MKKILSYLMILIAMLSTSQLFAQSSKTETFKVSGNCNMCKKRIEKAASFDGVSKAVWNVETKIMTVTYDSTKTSNEAIQKKIAGVGHDTEKQKAGNAVYEKLPDCCLYDRTGKSKADTHHH